jgi:hypothetical protein
MRLKTRNIALRKLSDFGSLDATRNIFLPVSAQGNTMVQTEEKRRIE